MNFTYTPNQIALMGEDGNILAKVTFPNIDADTVDIDHTLVDDSLRGQGVAGQLMEAAAKKLQEDNKKAVLTCSYAVKWFDKHPEYSSLVRCNSSDGAV